MPPWHGANWNLTVHLGLRSLLSFYEAHRAAESLVLVTVIGTEGSTYRKPGALMLIGADGSHQGMVSGGCLEQDLALRASRVFETGEPERFTYDLREDEQQPWGLGLGCDGAIHLLLQRLDREREFGFLGFLQQSLMQRRSCVLSLVTEAGRSRVPLGAFAICNDAGDSLADHDGLLADSPQPGPGQQRARAVARRIALGGQPLGVLDIRIQPTPRVLICGAGPDARPLADQVASLGWECWVVDHRPAYATADRFPTATAVLRIDPAGLSEGIGLGQIGAAVVMSHNQKRDEEYLRQLLAARLPYVGLLGPAARRQRLLERVGGLPGAVHGPAGLDIGAELPESIALSIMAEIHAVLNGRFGSSLDARGG